MTSFIKKFSEINKQDIGEVGGKNASLGEMFQQLSKHKINIPEGFATTAEAYWKFIDHNKLRNKIQELLSSLDTQEFSNLKAVGQKLRKTVMKAKMPEEVAQAIQEAYQALDGKGNWDAGRQAI